jgi:membrane-bound inhibitor of C-type lysozyme
MIRIILSFAACIFAGALPAIIPAALGQTQSAPNATEKPPVAGPTPTSYTCPNEQTFLVVYKSGEEADLMLGTRTFTLKQVAGGSGFKYTDGTLTLTGKGEEATLEGAPGAGAMRNCMAQKKRN